MQENKNEQHIDGLSCSCEHCNTKVNLAKKSESVISAYKFDLIKIALSIFLIVLAVLIENSIIKTTLFILSSIVCGYELLFSYVKGLTKGKIFNENLLMLIASVTAFLLGESFEGAFIITLFCLGETLESLATANSKKKIAGLAELKSYTAHLFNEKGMNDVSPEQVPVGSIIEVRKGERVAIDGVLLAGTVELDVKAVTGESKLSVVRGGEQVLSGSINVGNPFIIKTTKLYKDSTVEKIIQMVEGATAKKAKSQKFITAFAKVYTPIIFALAGIIAFIVPLFDKMNFVKWIYKSLSFLVVSCPCALVISVPLAFFVGIGSLAKIGVLVKGGNCIDNLEKIKTVVFDKTGTLTKGEFIIDKIITKSSFDESEVLSIVSSLEAKSNHPISKVITDNFKPKANHIINSVNEIVGQGLEGEVDGIKVLIGNEKLLQENGVKVEKIDYIGTVLYIAFDKKFVQAICISDAVKDGAKESVNALKKIGVNKTYMLSGDKIEIANSIGKALGVDEIRAELLPQDKLEALSKISNKNVGKIMFVGDGINDSPCLASADVGVAMGGKGSEIAIDSADVVVMDDNLSKISTAIKFSRKIKRTVLINVICSLGVKFLIMFLSLITKVPIWLAMFGDVGVMLLAVLNSLLSAKIRNK